MIRLLMIMTTPFDISGITNSVMDYYRLINKEKFHIDFVAPNIVPERLKNEILDNGGKVYELIIRNKNPLVYVIKLYKIIKKNYYHIVHAHGNSTTLAIDLLAAKIAKVPVRIAHSRNTTCKFKLLNKILRPLFNSVYTHGFACGNDAGKWLFKNKNFIVIKNGKNIDKFLYNEDIRRFYRSKYNINDQLVIGHVGSFNYQKNHDFLIEVFNEVYKINKNSILMLVGDGYLQKDIKEKVLNLNLEDKVLFIGKSFEVNNLLQAMDIMVLPSRYEGLPNVVIEWQISCLPSIISTTITNEVKITELVHFMNLDDGPLVWANKILGINPSNRKLIQDDVIRAINNAGYNIYENVKILENKYEDILKSESEVFKNER